MLQYFNKKQGERGFTLIELLVVIAIIGILATIVLVSLNSAREKARNTRRISDLRQIQLGNEIYYDDVGNYAANVAAIVANASMAAEPVDPGTGSSYDYCTGNSGYVVGALLVGDTGNLLDTSAGSAIETTYCNVGGVAVCGAANYYCVAP
jgi:prepilin-type N-terminal cleavage/methylation domain-containing protein